MSARPFTDELLDRLRGQGDPPADAAIAAVLASYPPERVLDVLQGLVRVPPDTGRRALYERLGVPVDLRETLETFFRDATALPSWADPPLMRRGREVYQRQVFFTFVTLACASLPACYCWSPEATILGITGRLERDVPRRLPETAQMVVDVMADGALFAESAAAGPGLRAVIKVRLMHATIRELIMRRGPMTAGLATAHADRGAEEAGRRDGFFARFVAPQAPDDRHPEAWNTARDGVPINQEQLAATLLTFSWVTLKAIRHFGVRVGEDEERAFMHRWNVIGHLLGIDQAVTTRLDDDAQVQALYEKMMARNRRATVDGPELERALIGYLESNIARRAPVFSRLGGRRVVRILTRDLAGDDTADVLDVRLGTGDRLYRVPVRLALALFGRMKNVRGLQLVSELVFRWLSRRLWDWRSDAPAGEAPAARREMGSGDVVLPAALTALRESVRRQS